MLGKKKNNGPLRYFNKKKKISPVKYQILQIYNEKRYVKTYFPISAILS